MPDFVVTVSADAKRISANLRKAAAQDLQRNLRRRVAPVAQPLIQAARTAAEEELPHHGGLADIVAKTPIRVKVKYTAKRLQVRIVAIGKTAAGTNRGKFRHPVWGNREVWVDQTTVPGWFTKTIRRNADEPLRRAVLRAVDDTLRNL